ncbi:MAG: hypothetical protein AAFQ41_02330 [Cyanobacteria bacterium J06623_7]
MNKLPKLEIFTVLLDLGITQLTDVLVYKMLCLRKKFRQQITVDAIALRKRITKLCKKFGVCDITVIRVLKRLAKAGLINIIYKIQGFGKYVIEVIPLHELTKHPNSDDTDLSNVVVASNPVTKAHKQKKGFGRTIDQQQLINADRKCRSVGIIFQREDLPSVAKYPSDEIDKAIAYFKFSDEKNHISNPNGWLIKCLEKKYYRTYRPEKFLKSAQQKLFELQDWFIDNFGSVPRRYEQIPLFVTKKTGSPHSN